MSDETIGGLIITLIIVGMLSLIGIAGYTDHNRNKKIDQCLKSGYVPIHEYCVKPGSFINMDEQNGSF